MINNKKHIIFDWNGTLVDDAWVFVDVLNQLLVPRGLNKTEFKKTLTKSFLNHPFVLAYLNYVDEGKFFGEMSSWLHSTVTTVPTPRRYDIKNAQSRINEFVVFLNDKYELVTPGRRSTRLQRIQ